MLQVRQYLEQVLTNNKTIELYHRKREKHMTNNNTTTRTRKQPTIKLDASYKDYINHTQAFKELKEIFEKDIDELTSAEVNILMIVSTIALNKHRESKLSYLNDFINICFQAWSK